MSSKRLDIKIRILLFIICTIGILYISAWIMYWPATEGFQQADNCFLDNGVTFPGKRIWFCPTQTNAINLFEDETVTLQYMDQVCYSTVNSDYPLRVTSNYYICYQRPAGKKFNFNDGVYVDNDSTEDTTAPGIENDITQVCSDYNGETARFKNILNSTVAYQHFVSSASGEITFTSNQLIGISTQYCVYPQTEQKFVDFCTALSTGIGIYIGLPGGHYGLNYISTTITAGIYASTNNLYTNIYQPGYNGFNC